MRVFPHAERWLRSFRGRRPSCACEQFSALSARRFARRQRRFRRCAACFLRRRYALPFRALQPQTRTQRNASPVYAQDKMPQAHYVFDYVVMSG